MGKDVKVGIGVALVLGLLLFIMLLARGGEEPVAATDAQVSGPPAAVPGEEEGEGDWTELQELELVPPAEETATVEITGPPPVTQRPPAPGEIEPVPPVYEPVEVTRPPEPPRTVEPEPAPVAPPVEPPVRVVEGAAPQLKTYTVQEDDNLWKLAERFYGDGSLWTRIADANRDVIPASNLLQVDTVLVIPEVGPGTAEVLPPPSRVERPSPLAPAADTTTYTVERGDTLYGIARKFYGDGDLYKAIYEANRNRLSSPDDLPVGTVLVIPPRPSPGQ